MPSWDRVFPQLKTAISDVAAGRYPLLDQGPIQGIPDAASFGISRKKDKERTPLCFIHEALYMSTSEPPSELDMILERFARQYPDDIFFKNGLRFVTIWWADLTNAPDKKKELAAGISPGQICRTSD